MPDLSDDEYSVLMIAAEGQSMMPIGRWEQPVESLVKKGFLNRSDKFNNYITPLGKQALADRELQSDQALANFNNNIYNARQVQGQIQAFAEQAAQLLAQAAKASNTVTGNSVEFALDQWATVIRERAKEILRS